MHVSNVPGPLRLRGSAPRTSRTCQRCFFGVAPESLTRTFRVTTEQCLRYTRATRRHEESNLETLRPLLLSRQATEPSVQCLHSRLFSFQRNTAQWTRRDSNSFLPGANRLCYRLTPRAHHFKEGEGVEPSEDLFRALSRFQGERLKPLGHPSVFSLLAPHVVTSRLQRSSRRGLPRALLPMPRASGLP